MNRLVIVGAGPIGLHAALQAFRNGLNVTVLDRGELGAAVRQWGHVKLFTPFSMNSTASGRAAAATSARLPEPDALLTGEAYVRQYLEPLAHSSSLAGHVQTHHELIAVSRQSYGKSDAIGKPERAASPFRLLVRRPDESEFVMECDMLFDCTGFATQHRFIGTGGIPCPGERVCLTDADYKIATPQPLSDRSQHTVVVGSGYSAATSICFLQERSQHITWITRGARTVPILPVADDSLPARRRLTDRANQLAVDPASAVHWLPGALIESMDRDNTEYRLVLSFNDGGTKTLICNRIVANPGVRPNVRPFEELQIHRCYATEGPIKMAAHLLGETDGDCLTQTVPGVELLRNPEPGFYILGAASYGRDSRFLLKNGLQQIEQLFEMIECPMETGRAFRVIYREQDDLREFA